MKKLLFFLTLISVIFVLFCFKCIQKSHLLNIYDDSILIVGTDANFPPFEYMLNDEIKGFDIDLVHALANKLDKKIIFKNINFDVLLCELQAGRIHMIASALTSTPERSKKVLMTEPYLSNDSLIVITLAQNSPKKLSDLQGKEVIVNDGFTAESFMEKQEGVFLKRLTSPAEAFLALTTNRGYAYVSARFPVLPYFDKYGIEKFNILELPVSESYVFAVSKKCPKLFDSIQKTLHILEKTGELEQLKKKWNLIF